MKKLLMALLALTFSVSAFALTGCDKEKEPNSTPPTTESTEGGEQGDGEQEGEGSGSGEQTPVYTVSATEWTTAFAVADSTNFHCVAKTFMGGVEAMENDMKLDGKKYSSLVKRTGTFETEMFMDRTGETPVQYVRSTVDGEFEPCTPDEMELASFDASIQGVLGISAYAKTYFESATYDETKKEYTLTVATANFTEFGIPTAEDLTYVVSFENGTIKKLKVSYSALMQMGPGDPVAMDTVYEIAFGGVVVNMPTVA